MSLAVIGTVAAVGAVGASAYAASQSGNAADTAAQAQNNATATNAQIQQNALNQQQANFNLVQSQEAPYRATGEAANKELNQMVTGGYNMQASPSAQYALSQGTKAINSNLQARGLEGNAVQQLGQLSSSTAATDYQNRFNNLLAATGVGQNATAMTGSATNALNSNIQSGANVTGSLGQQGAQNLGNIAVNNANTQSNIIGGAAGNLSTLAGQLGNYQSSGNNGSDVSVITRADGGPSIVNQPTVTYQ